MITLGKAPRAKSGKVLDSVPKAKKPRHPKSKRHPHHKVYKAAQRAVAHVARRQYPGGAFPVSATPVLNTDEYRSGPLTFPFFPEPVNVDAAIPRGRKLYSRNRARMTNTATGQWFERPIGGGSARTSPAYTQFAAYWDEDQPDQMDDDMIQGAGDFKRSAIGEKVTDPGFLLGVLGLGVGVAGLWATMRKPKRGRR